MPAVPERKIIDWDAVSLEIARQISLFMKNNDVKLSEIVDKLGKSSAYWSKLINGKATTNNEEVYERIAVSAWMKLSEFKDIVKRARTKAIGIDVADCPAEVNEYALLSRKEGIPEEDLKMMVEFIKRSKGLK